SRRSYGRCSRACASRTVEREFSRNAATPQRGAGAAKPLRLASLCAREHERQGRKDAKDAKNKDTISFASFATWRPLRPRSPALAPTGLRGPGGADAVSGKRARSPRRTT